MRKRRRREWEGKKRKRGRGVAEGGEKSEQKAYWCILDLQPE